MFVFVRNQTRPYQNFPHIYFSFKLEIRGYYIIGTLLNTDPFLLLHPFGTLLKDIDTFICVYICGAFILLESCLCLFWIGFLCLFKVHAFLFFLDLFMYMSWFCIMGCLSWCLILMGCVYLCLILMLLWWVVLVLGEKRLNFYVWTF